MRAKFAMIFSIVLIAIMVPVILNSRTNTYVENYNTSVKAAMTSATFDAVQTINLRDNKAFATDSQKTTALDTFYKTLSSGYIALGSGNGDSIAQAYIPFVALIDNEGVYICYSKDYDNEADADYKITPITAFAESYSTGNSGNEYIVDFQLNDYMVIYKNGHKLTEGNRTYVIGDLNKLDKAAFDSLPFLADKDMYEEERQAVVTNTVSRLITKYLNRNIDETTKGQGAGLNFHNRQYDFSIPIGENEDWQRALKSPTVVAFYQGLQYNVGDNYVAQVAFTGGELSHAETYYIATENGTKYYHKATKAKYDDGTIKKTTKLYTSMEDAARAGAYPYPGEF